MIKDFAGQPAGGGMIEILTGRELKTGITPETFPTPIFEHRPLFDDNCNECGQKMQQMNADGFVNQTGTTAESKTSTFDQIFGVIKLGADVWTTSQTSKTAQEQAQAALQIKQAEAEAERARIAAEEAKAASTKEKLKGYILPITVTGLVVIGGIAAYFYFKKKKIS